MAENSGISWTDHTFNPWIGCTKISPACANCYAARDNEHRKWVVAVDAAGKEILGEDKKRIAAWGEAGAPPAPRKRTAPANWANPRKWDRAAAISGKRPRVFVASLADVFDNEVDQDWRNDLWQLMIETPHLRWIPLTKRIGNVEKMVPSRWNGTEWPKHVGLMATLENQQVWDRDYPKLADWQGIVPWIGVSAEPLLGRIDIGDAKPDWIITGGESGHNFRPLDMDAVRFMQQQCDRNGVTFHHKQNGGIRGKDAGCLVDGIEYKHFPPALAA